MALSGTYGFNPSLGSITLYAFNRCKLRNTELLQEHYESARMAANMVLSDWSNKGVNLWQVTLYSYPLVQGQAIYPGDPSNVSILDAYISTVTGSQTIDRIILPVSRTEYASYPNKAQQGFPTTFWDDRLLQPNVYLWPVPDGTQTYLKYYALQQLQDANLTNAQQVDVPYLWMKAFSDALSVELAVIWRPEALTYLSPMAMASYATAAETNTEKADFFVSPQLSGYYRP